MKTSTGHYKECVVEVINKAIVKPFLGGYLNKDTQIEYHHGYTQTGPPQPKVPSHMKMHRDTQTKYFRNRYMETTYSRATQMANSEVWIPNVNDKLLVAGAYETADELERRLDKLNKIKTIQRYFRAYKIRLMLKEASAEYKLRVAKEREDGDYDLRADMDRKRRELIGKVFPRTKTDFDMLYTMLDRWKKAEIERITTYASGPSKIAEMYQLLEKEMSMLHAIDMHKETVKKDLQIQREVDFFKAISEPIFWHSDYKHIPIAMETLEVQNGQKYKAMFYEVANSRDIPPEERLQTLLNLKVLFKDHKSCLVSNELLGLIDRACTLLARGIDEKFLDILQLRIEHMLLKHIKMPECCQNVASRVNRVQEEVMKDNLFYCPRCQSLKTSDKFPISSRMERIKICTSCNWDDRLAMPWLGISPYRFILRCIRREERRKQAASSIAFILQDRDIQHIIINIWHSHSAINECTDIYQLRLCRWFTDRDWSPWNCVLLTMDETKHHNEIKKLEDVYDPEFLYYVYNKHQLARRYYRTALHLEEYFLEIGDEDTRWNEIRETVKFVPVSSKMKIFLSCH